MEKLIVSDRDDLSEYMFGLCSGLGLGLIGLGLVRVKVWVWGRFRFTFMVTYPLVAI